MKRILILVALLVALASGCEERAARIPRLGEKFVPDEKWQLVEETAQYRKYYHNWYDIVFVTVRADTVVAVWVRGY